MSSRVISDVRVRVVHPRRRRRVVLGLVLGVATAALVATNAPASASLPVCHDSNGRAPGGSVYVVDGHALGCDVVHGQRLHVTRVRTLAACDDMGGRYAATVDVCWDVDF